MKLIRLSLVFTVLTVLSYAHLGFSMWYCGDIELPASPQALTIDPVTGDLFVASDTTLLIRIDEATYETSQIDLMSTAAALGLNPASRLLYAVHTDAGLITIIDIDTADTTLIDVGSMPSGIAIDGLRNKTYVTNTGSNTISVIQGTALTDTLGCEGSPSAVVVDPATGRGFTVLKDLHLLFAFDVASGDTAYFPMGLGPSEMEIDPEKGELYIANSGDNTITVFVMDSDSLFSVPVGGAPNSLALNPETRRLFVGMTSNDLTILNTDAYTTQNVGLPSTPHFLSIDALSDRAFASLPETGLLVELSSNGDTLLASVPGTPGMLLVNPITNKCYICNSQSQALSVLEAANYSGERVAAGGGPGRLVINLEDHKVYTPNWFSKSLTVIDGYSNAVSTIPTADGPNGLVIDPVTDDVFVVCAWANLLTVVRNGGPDTLLVPIGDYSHGIGVNPNTGKIYVSNRYSRDVSIIDAQTLDTTLVRAGAYPCHVAINLDYNKIYVVNRTSWTLTVIDGGPLSTSYVRVGRAPTTVEVNPVTNKVVTNDPNSRSITIVDGLTHDRVTVPVGTTPPALGINTNTNKIYVSSRIDGEVTVVDGDTYRRTPVRCEPGLFEVMVDQWLDKAFTVSWDWASVTLIDGNLLSTLRIPVGEEPHSSAYDPVLEKLYVSNHGQNSIEIIKLREKISPRVEVAIDTLPGDVAYTSTPTITGTATSLRTPRNYGIMKVLYKIDNLRGPWKEATMVGAGTDVSWVLTTPPLLLGRHLIFVAAIDSTACSLSSSSASSLLRISDIACYEFTCLTTPPEAPKIVASEGNPGDAVSLSWTHTCGSSGWYEIEVSSDPSFSAGVTRITGIKQPSYTFTQLDLLDDTCYWRVAAVDYPHGKRGPFSEVYSIGLSNPADDEAQPAAVTMTLVAYPNPSSQTVSLKLLGRGTGQARCSIYDVTGQLLTILPMASVADGMVASWEATDSQGQRLPPGVYYARVAIEAKTLTHKIILLR